MNLPRRGRESGNAIIEFAFVLPLLLATVAGIVDFGFLFQRYEVITNAAREGARMATLPGYTTPDVQARVASYLQEGLNLTPAQVAATSTVSVARVPIVLSTGTSIPGAQVTVQHSGTYILLGPITALLGGTIGDTFSLTARSTMRLQIAS